MKERVTISQVAEKVGLSKTLVSMVLNGKGDQYNISIKTQKLVEKTAKSMNYRPSLGAKALRTGSTNTVGLVIPDISNIFFAKICRILEESLEKKGLRLITSSSNDSEQTEIEQVEYLLSTNVDGIIVASSHQNDEYYKSLTKKGLPVVFIDRHFEDSPIPSIVTSNYSGAYRATKRLLEKSGSKIKAITLTPSHLSTLSERIKGYKNAMQDAKIGVNDQDIILIDHTCLEQDMASKITPVLDKEDLDGFFITNNSLTIELLKVLKQRRKTTPDNLSLISFDDIPLFELIEPPVTALSQPVEGIASKSAELISEQIRSKELVSGLIELPVQLINRFD